MTNIDARKSTHNKEKGEPKMQRFANREEMDATDQWLEGLDPELDNEGQIIFYTGLFEHSDGTIHTEPEVCLCLENPA